MKKIVSALLFCALLLSLAACSQKSPTAQETEPESSAARTVTDSFGREVTIPAEVKAIVCTGSGALRMVTYLQCTDRLVGVEDCDKEYADSTLRDYAYVYHDTFDALPSIGKGGGTANTAYVEELIRLQPDVILSGYTQEALEDLAQSTGIPCVSIRAKSINFIDDSFYTAMRVAAEVLGVQERCEEVLQYIDGCKADLDARTADIPDEGKPAVYAGAVTFSGAHGFTGTYSNFGPLMAIHANNVADEMGELLSEIQDVPVQNALTAAAYFHAKFENIHPFADGNGRVGRLWHTLLLSKWNPAFAWLPVESIIHDRQEEYYAAINASNDAGESTVFIEFMLSAIKASLIDAINASDEVSDGATDKATMRWKQIEKFLETHPYIMNADVRALCGVSAATANRILAGLAAEGKLVKYREGGHWAYKLLEQ